MIDPGRLRLRQRPVMRFMLTPLVDVIFLLLTFFMLSSDISAYSFLPLGARGGASSARAATAPDLVVVIDRGAVQANGERIALSDFAAAARDMRGRGLASAVVSTRPAASVEDVVTVLGALTDARFRSVNVRLPAAPT